MKMAVSLSGFNLEFLILVNEQGELMLPSVLIKAHRFIQGLFVFFQVLPFNQLLIQS